MKVTIHCKLGLRVVDGFLPFVCRGEKFVVTPTQNEFYAGSWGLTHIKSGMAVSVFASSKKAAKDFGIAIINRQPEEKFKAAIERGLKIRAAACMAPVAPKPSKAKAKSKSIP